MGYVLVTILEQKLHPVYGHWEQLHFHKVLSMLFCSSIFGASDILGSILNAAKIFISVLPK